jgi:hypothetical protein
VAGLGELTPVNRSCASDTHEVCDRVSVNEESREHEETSECIVQVKCCYKTGVIDQDSRKGNEYRIS